MTTPPNTDRPLFSVRQAAKLIGCSTTTIQSDITSGRVVPYYQAAHRDPGGSRVDLADMVLIAGLRFFTELGISLSAMDLSGPLCKQHMAFTLTTLSTLSRAIVGTTPAGIARAHQLFLEATDYETVMIAARVDSGGGRRWVLYPAWAPKMGFTVETLFRTGIEISALVACKPIADRIESRIAAM